MSLPRRSAMWAAAMLLSIVSLLVGATAERLGEEGSIRLRPGAGSEQVQAYCSICHSLDYIQMNAGFLDAAGWDKEVRKMIKVMGAPIPEDQVTPIVAYLAGAYGRSTAEPVVEEGKAHPAGR
jgi:mono/diheme cytochrome c family protein